MCESLPYDAIKFDKNFKSEEILNAPHDSDIGCFVEVDIKYLDEIKEKTKFFEFCPEKRISPQDKFNNNTIEMKPCNITENRKIICDWTDRKNCLVHYRMLNFFVRDRMVVEFMRQLHLDKKNGWRKILLLLQKRKIQL